MRYGGAQQPAMVAMTEAATNRLVSRLIEYAFPHRMNSQSLMVALCGQAMSRSPRVLKMHRFFRVGKMIDFCRICGTVHRSTMAFARLGMPA